MRGEERELKEIVGGLLRDGLNSLRPVTENNSPRPVAIPVSSNIPDAERPFLGQSESG